MKGISMPINIVVVLLLAVIVLVALIFWFMSTVPPTTSETSWQIVLRNCCSKWASLGCGVESESSVKCSVPAGLSGTNCKSTECSIKEVAADARITDVKRFCGC